MVNTKGEKAGNRQRKKLLLIPADKLFTSWTGWQPFTALTYRESLILTFTLTGNLESPVNYNCMILDWEVNRVPRGKPHMYR